MKVEFKSPKKIDGKMYAKGMHDLPSSFLNHWFFKGLVAQKEAHVLDAAISIPDSGILKEDAALSLKDDTTESGMKKKRKGR